MSDSTTQGIGAMGPPLKMSSDVQSDLLSRANQFSSMLSGGAGKSDIMDGISNLESGAEQAIRGSYDGNASGLDNASYKALQGADYAFGQLKFQMAGGQDVTKQLADLTNTFKSELSPQQSAPAPQAGGAAGVGAAGGTQQEIMQVLQLLAQLLQKMGGQGAESAGGPAAQGAGTPAGQDAGGAPSGAGGLATGGGAPGGLSDILKELTQLLQQMGGQGAQPASQATAGGAPSPGAGSATDPGAAPPGSQGAGGAPPSGAGGSEGAGGSGNMQQAMLQLLNAMVQMMQQMGGGGAGTQTAATE